MSDGLPGNRPPSGDEAGAENTPAADGRDTVDLGDRTGAGSPGSNQSKPEPMPPTQGHDDPDAAEEPATVEAPDLGSMNVGASDPQAPSHASAGPAGDRADSGMPSLGTTPTSTQPGADNLGTPTGDGLAERERTTTGSAFRPAGSNGVAGDEEELETDVDTSAARTNPIGTPGTARGAGDAQGVPVVSEEISPGTSQESSVAQGARTPE
ncbi:MAG: hypothetical protein JWN77_271 [Frankiales bacterium]|nr:hypothetical protein [Frankiales bacterium]